MAQIKSIVILFLSLFAQLNFANNGLNVKTVYVHGFSGSPEGAAQQKEAFPSSINFEAPFLPDTQKETGFGPNRLLAIAASYLGKNINRSHAYMGQGPDIQAIANCINEKKIDTSPFTLFGICRGGSAAINYIAEHNPKNLKAVVVEASPSNMPGLLHDKMAKIGISPTLDKYFFKLMFSAYPKNSIPPIQALQDIQNKDLPVLLLHSKEDKYIPFSQALDLYSSFKNSGFKNIHLVALNGKHSKLLEQDKDAYLKTVHSFYKKYGLMHNSNYAIDDINNLSNYDIDKATFELNLQRIELQKQIQNSRKGMVLGAILILASVYAWNYLTNNKPSQPAQA